MQSAPPLWNSPQPGAPPAAATTPLTKRFETLGNVSLALGALELLSCVQRLIGPLFGKAILDFQRNIMPKTPHGPSFDEILDAGKDLMNKVTLWEAVRAVPFLIATSVLIWIALRLRKADAGALRAARTWSLAALGVVVLSTLIQIFVTIPATMEYQRALVKTMTSLPTRGGAAPPFDMGEMMSKMTIISSLIGLVVGVVFLSAWPIVLYVWAGKIQKDAAPPGSA
jgi:hypothetical protein